MRVVGHKLRRSSGSRLTPKDGAGVHLMQDRRTHPHVRHDWTGQPRRLTPINCCATVAVDGLLPAVEVPWGRSGRFGHVARAKAWRGRQGLSRRPAISVPERGAPGRIRTADTRFRRAVLYPLSYRRSGPRRPVTGADPRQGYWAALPDRASTRLVRLTSGLQVTG